MTPHTHHRALSAMIHANGRADVGRVTRMILDGLDDQARKLLRAIERDIRDARDGFDTRLSMFAILGGEPAVRDLIRQSKHHRERAMPSIAPLKPVSTRVRNAA